MMIGMDPENHRSEKHYVWHSNYLGEPGNPFSAWDSYLLEVTQRSFGRVPMKQPPHLDLVFGNFIGRFCSRNSRLKMVEWFAAWLNQCILMYEICYINSTDKIIEHVDIRSGATHGTMPIQLEYSCRLITF